MKLKPEIYLKAAKRIANANEWDFKNSQVAYCCYAISDEYHINEFSNIFKPESYDDDEPWYETYYYASKEDQEARRLALLFMYEMTKNGDI